MCIYYNTALALGTQLQRGFSSSQLMGTWGCTSQQRFQAAAWIASAGAGLQTLRKSGSKLRNFGSRVLDWMQEGSSELSLRCLWLLLLPQALGLTAQLLLA